MKDRLVRLFRSIEHAAGEVEHQRVVLDGLIDDQRAVPGVEPGTSMDLPSAFIVAS